jgi:hypothetical protein
MCWLICAVIMGVLSAIFETFASFSDMVHFQCAMKLYLCQLVVNCDGEKNDYPHINQIAL